MRPPATVIPPAAPSGKTITPQVENAEVAKSCLAVHFSSLTAEWPTPQWLFDVLDKEFGFTLDPCSNDANAKCPKHFTQKDSGLLKSWRDEIVFMNPPYGREIVRWMAKAHDAATVDGATVVCLVPARTDTAWWHKYAMKHEIRLLRGRLKFGDGRNPAPFPSAVIVMRPAQFILRAWSIKAGSPGESGAREVHVPAALGEDGQD